MMLSQRCDSFESDIYSEKPLACDFSYDSASVLIAFGGIFGAMGIPPFEFFKLSGSLPINKIYIRDTEQGWYHFGLPGVAEDIEGVATYLKGELDFLGLTRTVFVGNSMGGFASILFGSLLNATVVHAFSPQTFINRFTRWRYSDRRWAQQIKRVQHHRSRRYFDLKKVLNQIDCTNTFINIYYSADDQLDRIHAERMYGVKNVILHSYPQGGHQLIRSMKDSGELLSIVHSSFC